MPRNVNFQLEGLTEALGKIDNLRKSAEGRKAIKAVDDAAKVTQKSVLSRTPKGPTGNLRRSIKRGARPHFVKGYEKLRRFVYSDRKIAPHLHLVEFGHGGPRPAPAHPFFRPGVESARDDVRRILTSGMKEAFKL